LLSATTQCFADEPQSRNALRRAIGGGPTVTNINGAVIVERAESSTLSFVNIDGDVWPLRRSLSEYTEPSEIGDVEARNCKSVLLQGNLPLAEA
jgi:hypothetical protein